MARVNKTVHVDIATVNSEDTKALVRTYGGRIDRVWTSDTFVCAQIPRTRLSHFKGTATKKGLTLTINA